MLLLKGFIIGLGKIIPGLSGSMLAISMGVYQRLIDCINNFFKDIKKNSVFLFKVFVGVLLGIVIFSKIILNFLSNYYIITMFLFIGLIIGGFDGIKKEMEYRNNKIILITIIITLLLASLNIEGEFNSNNIFYCFFYFFFVGIIDAVTMVIPGISGTATLMMIGAYNILMETFSNIFSLSILMNNLTIMLPFSFGMIVGIAFSVKLINYLFLHYKQTTYNMIMGFAISSIITMALKCINSSYNFLNLIIAFVLLFVGIYLSKKINHLFSND